MKLSRIVKNFNIDAKRIEIQAIILNWQRGKEGMRANKCYQTIGWKRKGQKIKYGKKKTQNDIV